MAARTAQDNINQQLVSTLAALVARTPRVRALAYDEDERSSRASRRFLASPRNNAINRKHCFWRWL